MFEPLNPAEPGPIAGVISNVEDFGTIVLVWIVADSGAIRLVHCDQRPFRQMNQARGGRLIGQRVAYHDDAGDDPWLEFEADL